MDSSESPGSPARQSGGPSQEHVQLVPATVTLASSTDSANTCETNYRQPQKGNMSMESSAPTSAKPSPVSSHASDNTPAISATQQQSVSTPIRSPVPTSPVQTTSNQPCGSPASLHATPAVCPSVSPRSAEEGVVCVCPPDRTTLSPARGGSPLTVLRTETERPGPSGGSGAVEGSSSSGWSSCRALDGTPGHVVSMPDVRRQREEAEVATTPLSPAMAAAATSAGPATGQTVVGRPSVGSGIRAALQSAGSHASFASPLSSIGPFCRICHEGESREQLISPCRCAGSVGLVHASCIEKWLSAANKDSCEICMYRYVTERRPKPLLEWLLHPSNPEDARNLLGDVICFFLLTALAVIAAYLCLMALLGTTTSAAGASHYLSYKTQWEATGLVVLGLIISTIYCVWLVVTCRYHCRVWRDWRQSHQDVHLLNMKRLSHSSVDLNNNPNNPTVPVTSAVTGCRACRGGSYSCARCCAACPVHGAPAEAGAAADATAASVVSAAVASAVGAVDAGAVDAGGVDDVFDEDGGLSGSVCGAMEAVEDGRAGDVMRADI